MQPEPAVKRAVYALIPDLRAVRERPLFPIAVYMMLGSAFGAFFPVQPAVGFLVLLGLFIFTLFLFALRKDVTLPLMLMAFVAGYTLMASALPKWAADPWAPQGQAQVAGRIAQAGTTQGGYADYVLDGVTVNGAPVEGSVSLTTRGTNVTGGVGDTLTAQTELARPAPSRYYGDFNARGWYMRRGVRFTGFVSEAKITPSGAGPTVGGLPERARRYAAGVLKQYLSPDNAALVSALLSGDTSGISQEDRNAFRDLGIAHLLAVSGLNISLTAGAAWLLCRRLRLPMPVSWGISFLVMLSYVLFAGLTPSVLRAAVMWVAMMGGLALARRYDPLSSISAAAIVLLMLNPLDLFDAGFQLSFAATAAIFLWHAPLAKVAPKNKALKFFFESIGLTLCVTLFALPIILGCFNQISPVSPFANLLLVPASFILQLGGTALLFVGFMPGAAQMLGGALNWYGSVYLHSVSAIAWTSAPVPVATPALWLSAAFAVFALLVSPSVARYRPGGRACMAAGLAVTAVLMLTPASAALTWRSDAAVVSEGGSSLSVWWSDDGRNYAACGGDWQALAGYLRSRGISHLDGLYVLASAPPKDGSVLLEGGGVKADKLYVPGRWLLDPAAKNLLEQAVLLQMRPTAAEYGPFEAHETQSSAALYIPCGGGVLAFVPYASVKDFSQLTQRLAIADAVAVNVPAGRAAKLLGGAVFPCAILPGPVEGPGYPLYNSTACGSIEVGGSGGGLTLLPWREGWADGIQGNFR